MIPTDDFVLPGTNTTLRPFPFRFEFPITETVEFFTDILEAGDGTEQRIAFRDPARPRLHIAAHVIVFDRDEVTHLKALLFGWNLRQYGVPLWYHAMRLSADASMGDTELTVDDCDGRDLADRIEIEEDVPVLLWRAHDDWEPGILADASDGTLTLRDGIARDWPAGETLVLPLALMLIVTDPMSIETDAPAIAEMDVEFVSAIYTLSANAACGDEDSLSRALMVRPYGTVRSAVAAGAHLDHDLDNAGSLHPQGGDSPHDLFGFSADVVTTMVAENGSGMYSTSKGRTSGFSRCTNKCPADFKKFIFGAGLVGGGGGVGDPDTTVVVGDDYTVSVFQGAPAQDFPAGIPVDGNYIISSGFSGSGFFPAPGDPTGRSWVRLAISIMSGVKRAFCATTGDNVSSYARYDDTEMSGIKNYNVDPSEQPLNSRYVQLPHGFCVRLANVAAYKGVKVVTEEVLYEMDGVTETGTFGTPNVTTHDFTSDDYAAADVGAPAPGFFFSVPAGGTTIFGGDHDQIGDGYGGYNHGTDKELFRVTVSLYDVDDVDHEQWIDIFPTMLISAVMGT